MINLAGKPVEEADRIILEELTRCQINVRRYDNLVPHPEVHTHFTGRLGEIAFRRHWYYWGANGPVPLAIARELYEDYVGRKDIRVRGHCGCPPPEAPWITWRMPDGRTVVRKAEEQKYRGFIEREILDAKVLDEHVFADDPEAAGATGYIESYHIDSELGLYLFANAIRTIS